ncbi:MAG: 50S ribosomal protein L17 [Spirochaetales bacterium]|nr:50S ribosomal protein L17 [Spirochaetales bacterium]
MKHRVALNKLSKKAGHRKAMIRNMVTSLFKFERIRTTKAKARAVRQKAEKMITRAKVDNVHNRRIIGRKITQRGVVTKLFKDIAPRFKERPGGYTRILKLQPRITDASEMVFLELLDRKVKPKKEKKKSAKDTQGKKD